jgi:hypothetical protein
MTQFYMNYFLERNCCSTSFTKVSLGKNRGRLTMIWLINLRVTTLDACPSKAFKVSLTTLLGVAEP